MFLGKIGNKNFTLLSKMLDLLSANQRVYSQNVANVNTPNYRRRQFRFDSALRNAMQKGTPEAYADIQGYVSRPNNTPVRNNGNNVDIDREMISINENGSEYQIYTNIYVKKSGLVKKAIRG